MRIETQAREAVLKALYQHDLVPERPAEELRRLCGATRPDQVGRLAVELFDGCMARRAELDEIIRRTAENWELDRMATSDRNILRLGAFELLFRPETPPKVAINEAIELAKKYSTENSPHFINGILDRIYNTERADSDSPGPAGPSAAPRKSQGGTETGAAGPDPQARADLHVHSNASDGSVPPEELPALASKAGLRAFALTDHDSVEGVAGAREAAAAVGVEVVSGVELTGYAASRAEGARPEVHVAGLFVDDASRALRGELERLRAVRVERIHKIARKLQGLGIEVRAEDVMARSAGGAVGRVHLAQEMAERGHCRSIGEAFGRYLSAGCPAYVPKEIMTPTEAIELIRRAGGCSVLCHPAVGNGVEEHLEELVEAGLDGLEVHYPTHSAEDEKRLLDAARRFGLVPTGGSDFHGDPKPDVHIGQESVSFVELEELRRRAAART